MGLVITTTMARTVYCAEWVLPIVSAPIVDGAVIVDAGRLAWVGAASAIPPKYAQDRRVELGSAILMPGLVNAHTHLELTAMRGFLEGLSFREWLSVLTRARHDCYTPDSLYDSACAGVEEALRNGITTCADTTESGQPLEAMRDLGIRGIGYIEVFGPDPAQCAISIADLTTRARAQRRQDTSLVRTGLSPHAPYTVSSKLFGAVAELSRAEQWPIAVHVAESIAETHFVRDGAGPFADGLRGRGIPVAPLARSPIDLLAATGILSCEPLLIHAIQVDDQDIACIADHGAGVVHCPISNLKLGHGIAPLERFQSAGIHVGLGSDSVASNDRMDLLGEARQATLLQALRRGVPDALGAHEALALATLGGAQVLGLADRVGSLEVGKEADLAAFSLDFDDARPVHDPAVTLVHVLAGAMPAKLVVVAGRERVRDGVVLDSDVSRRERMEQLGARLRAWRVRYLSA